MTEPDLVDRPLPALADALEKRDVSSLELTEHYLRRIDDAQRGARPFALVFHDEARAQARAADARRAQGAPLSRWDGVPVTLKENLDLIGTPSTLGLPSRRGHRAVADAAVVGILRDAGAVFLGKTNVSQALLFHESRNPVYGVTQNPFAAARVPGGSSGGEACAHALGLAPGGFGTDIGGSIRIPCHFSGTTGLKPTVDRLSALGVTGAVPGQETVRGQIGPMGRTVADVDALLRLVSPAACAARDPRVPALDVADYRAVDVRALRVALFVDDGVVRPSRAVVRALDVAARALQDAGAVVEPWTPPRYEEALFTYFGVLSADGAQTLRAQVDRADLDDALSMLWRMTTLPAPARAVLAKALAVSGDRIPALQLRALGEKSVAALFKLTRTTREITAQVFADLRARKFDLILCPVHATPALQHGASRDFAIAGAASMYANMLHFPAGAVPVTTVLASEASREQRPGRLEARARAVDDGSVGLPVGVQVIGLPFQEHTVLAGMAAIEQAVQGDEAHPRNMMRRRIASPER